MTKFNLKVFFLLVLTIQMSEQRHRQRRMVWGNIGTLKNWFFSVSLVKNNVSENLARKSIFKYCGGILITSEWVLTAAHCAVDVLNDTSSLSVRIGSVDRDQLTHYNVSKILIHPEYIHGNDSILPNDDIALIKLNRSANDILEEMNSTNPIIKYASPDEKGFNCMSAGWGKDQPFKNLNEMYQVTKLPKYLTEINVTTLNRSMCLRKLNETKDRKKVIIDSHTFWKQMFCGGADSANEGTACLYDSGSPLVCNDTNNVRKLYGMIVAIHKPDLDDKPCTPGQQTIALIRISYYTGWIRNVTRQQ